MIPYTVKTIDLSVAETTAIVGPGSAITSFLVQSFPGGGGVIRLGLNGQDIPAVEGMEWEYDPCKQPQGETEGLYFRQPVAGAGTAVIIAFHG